MIFDKNIITFASIHNRFYKFHPNMPQQSITNFFKPKQTPLKGGTDDVKVQSTDQTEPENRSSKREADDQGDINNKRVALSKPEESNYAEGSQDKPHSVVVMSQNKEKSDKVCSNLQSTPQSIKNGLLVDTRTLIRKKISSGAFALHENIGLSWFRALHNEFDKPYFKKLSTFVKEQRQNNTVFPPDHKVYTWTRHHDIKDTRVVILGQDPYHGPGQAHGLSFSVQQGVRIPPSLINIYKELENDIPGFNSPKSGDLTGWAKQGVLMLNACLTVNQGQANSHQNKGWETFTDAVISWISKNVSHNLVFLLWGRPAQKKTNIIDKRHKVLTAAHPSPLSAHNGFFGCGHFSKTNQFLKSQDLREIDWKAL